jgi:site-specific DNA-methyltransferase (adenine-specific)
MNYLCLGDCLEVLRDFIPDESVDLIYIDPPFNSKRNYNIFFDDKEIQAQRIAFEDTWTFKNINDSFIELNTFETENLYSLLDVYQRVVPSAFPYLVMMTLRIIELHRVLKPTGSFYLHCDPNMSHYLKTICDLIFEHKNFKNEIVWCYKLGGRPGKGFPKKHDIILFYTRDIKKFNFYSDSVRVPYESSGGYVSSGRKIVKSKEYKINPLGKVPEDWWFISALNRQSKERLGYPTQKPLTLLERIIKASSKEGDVVLDGFCGCGTTIDAAERLNRKWIGIDISIYAVYLIKKRLENSYKAKFINTLSKYDVRGIPTDTNSAIKLWEQNPFAFQDWWVMEFEAFSPTYGTKGADKGVDGLAMYNVGKNKTVKAAFQVKGGKVQSKDIDALLGAMEKHKCELGIFLSIKSLTKPMLETITKAGNINIENKKYPKLQYMTIDDFFFNKKLKLPEENITFKSAKFKGKAGKQGYIF